jgi:hypothetical protein
MDEEVVTTDDVSKETEIVLSDYILIVKIPFKAIDDIDAKKLALKELLAIVNNKEMTVKLQRVYSDRPPVGIVLK